MTNKDAITRRYPRLCSTVLSIHKNPNVGLISRIREGGERNSTALLTSDLGDTVVELVNQTGAALLTESTGAKTVKEIAGSLRKEGNLETFTAEAGAFFQEAAKRHLVHFSETPDGTPFSVSLTGSSEYYTPFHISVELTNRCNLRCAHCYNSFEKDARRLTTYELISVLDKWRKLGLHSVELTGGEPLLHEDLLTILEYCMKTFTMVSLLTNGTLMTEDLADRIAGYRDKLIVGISVDGGRAETHEAVRGPGSFARTVEAIRMLRHRGVVVRMAMSLTPRNSTDLENAAELARALDVNFFSFSPILPFGRGRELVKSWRAGETHAVEQMMIKVKEQYKDIVPVFPKEALEGGAFGNCGIGHKNVVLSPSGKIRACFFLSESDCIGDVRSNDLIDIFRQPHLHYFGELRSPSPDRCAKCRYATFCAGCAVRALTILDQEGRMCQWAENNHIRECFPRYREFPYEAASPHF